MKRNTEKTIDKAEERRKRLEDAAKRAQEEAAQRTQGHPYEEAVVSLSNSLTECLLQNPCAEAWKAMQARTDAAGALSPEVEQLFAEIQAAQPDESLVLHHLAIIRHGRAIQKHLEGQSADPATLEDWKAGLAAWATLIGSDRFWRSLAERWRTRQARHPGDPLLQGLLAVDLDALRRRIGAQLLRVHVDVAVEAIERQTEVAKAHFNLLAAAPLDEADIAAAKKSVYQRAVGDVSKLCGEERFGEAKKRIGNYLKLEPGSAKARGAAVRIAVAEAEFFMKRQDEQALSTIRSAAQHAEHAALIADARAGNFTAKETLRDYYTTGCWAVLKATKALSDDQSARCVELIESGFQMTDQARVWEPNSADVRTQRIVLAVNGAVADVFHAGGRLHKARTFIRRGLAEDNEHACLHALEAFCCIQEQDFSAARSAMAKARRCNQSNPDENATFLIQNFPNLN